MYVLLVDANNQKVKKGSYREVQGNHYIAELHDRIKLQK